MRTSFLKLVSVLLLLVLPALGDSKIKTRQTMAGQAMEGTVYIKGARERREQGGMMGMPGMVTITQCDRKRMIQINSCTRTYVVTPLDEPAGEAEAAEAPAPAQPRGATRKGGVVTITQSAQDTGQRQKMFGLEARRVKASMVMESSPDACSPAGMRMETDGWYADIAPSFSCEVSPARTMPRMGGGYKPECQDRFRFRRQGLARKGFALKETMTMTSQGQTFTTTTEVVDLSTATLNPALFEPPVGYREVSSYEQMMGSPQEMMACMGKEMPSADIEIEEAPLPAPAAKPEPAAAPAAPPVPAKRSGVLRIGVVKLQDKTGQYLPVDNLRMNLMFEVAQRKYEVVPLDAELGLPVIEEAKQKDCDYILYTNMASLAAPGAALPMPPPAKSLAADAQRFQSLLDFALFKTHKDKPQLKTVATAAAPIRGVDAVMEGFVKEADAVAEQIKKDLAPPKAAPAARTPGRKPAPKKK